MKKKICLIMCMALIVTAFASVAFARKEQCSYCGTDTSQRPNLREPRAALVAGGHASGTDRRVPAMPERSLYGALRGRRGGHGPGARGRVCAVLADRHGGGSDIRPFGDLRHSCAGPETVRSRSAFVCGGGQGMVPDRL